MEIIFFILCMLSDTNIVPQPVSDFIEDVTPSTAYNHITLSDLFLSVDKDDLKIDITAIDFKSDRSFRINRCRDTIIIQIVNNYFISILSSSDSLYLIYNSDTKQFERDFRYHMPFYEKELSLKWDIDSLEILCLYNRSVYDHLPKIELYRFIIDHGMFTKEHKSFTNTPELPDEFVNAQELVYRQIDRHELYLRDRKKYMRLFGKDKNITLLSKIARRLFARN